MCGTGEMCDLAQLCRLAVDFQSFPVWKVELRRCEFLPIIDYERGQSLSVARSKRFSTTDDTATWGASRDAEVTC